MMKDHEIAAIVNQLRDIAKEYGQTQQLRERIAAVVVPLLASKPAAPMDNACALSEGYRRGLMEAFHVANMIHANRQGRTAEETCAYLVRRLAGLANGGEEPATPAQSGEPVEADVVPNEIAELLTEPCWNLSRRDVSDLLKRIGSILYTAPQPSQPAQSGDPVLPVWFDMFLTNVCEIPDRNSPEGEPEAMIATAEELRNCALNAIENTAANAGDRDERPISPADISAAADAVQRTYGVSGDIAEQIAVAVIDTLIARGNHPPYSVPSAVALDDERAAAEWALFALIPCGHHEWAQRHRKVFSTMLARAASPQATEDTPAKLARDAVRMLEGYAESYESMAKMDSKSGDGTVQCRSVARDIRANMAGWFGPHLTVQATATQPAQTSPAREPLSPEARAFYARHEARMGRSGTMQPAQTERALTDGTCQWREEEGNFGDRIVRCLTCGVHRSNPCPKSLAAQPASGADHAP